jgi:hypothetical protein
MLLSECTHPDQVKVVLLVLLVSWMNKNKHTRTVPTNLIQYTSESREIEVGKGGATFRWCFLRPTLRYFTTASRATVYPRVDNEPPTRIDSIAISNSGKVFAHFQDQ